METPGIVETKVVIETTTLEDQTPVTIKESNDNSSFADSEIEDRSNFRSCGISDRIHGGGYFWFKNLQFNLTCWD
jgi:hypothetical protein